MTNAEGFKKRLYDAVNIKVDDFMEELRWDILTIESQFYAYCEPAEPTTAQDVIDCIQILKDKVQ